MKEDRSGSPPDAQVRAQDSTSLPAELTPRLVKKDPETAGRLLDSLPLEERVRLVSRFRGADRLNLILASSQAEMLVKALPPPEFWLTVKDIGEEDSIDLLRMSSPSQVQYIFDLEWWHEYLLDPLAVAYWIHLLNEAGPETALAWFRQADEELLISLLYKFCRVYKSDPENQGGEPWRVMDGLWTLDDMYYLHFLHPDFGPVLQRFLETVCAEEPMKYYALLDQLEVAGLPEIEETAHRFRMARLADFGFVDFEESLEIYAPLSDRELSELEQRAAPPRELGYHEGETLCAGQSLALTDLPGFLQTALSLVQDPEVLENVRLGLGVLTNRILIADKMNLAKMESVEKAMAKAKTFVELGLLRWGRGDPERAAHILRTQHLLFVFRAGFTDLLELARRARTLVRQEWPSRLEFGLELLEEDGKLIEGLTKPRPLYYSGLDEKGSPQFREFTTRQEIARAEQALSRARALGVLFFQAFSCSEQDLELLKANYLGVELSFRAVFLTAVVKAFSGEGFAFVPVTREEAEKALENIFTGKPPFRVREDVKRELTARVEKAMRRLMAGGEEEIAAAKRFVEESLALLEEEFKEQDFRRLDPRFIKSLVFMR